MRAVMACSAVDASVPLGVPVEVCPGSVAGAMALLAGGLLQPGNSPLLQGISDLLQRAVTGLAIGIAVRWAHAIDRAPVTLRSWPWVTVITCRGTRSEQCMPSVHRL